MNFNEYQTEAHKTSKYKLEPTFRIAYDEGNGDVSYSNVPSYPFIKIMAESAEIAKGVIKKALRGDEGSISELHIAQELGDILWYCAEIASVCGFKLEYIAQMNINKLKDRQNRNKIHGSGDYR